LGIPEKAADDVAQAAVRELAREELEEAFELVPVSPRGGRELGWISLGGGVERPNLELQALAKALNATEHADRGGLAEAVVEQFDVVPDPRVDPAARVDELEREVWSAVARPQPLLTRHCVDALDDAVLGQLRDRAHALPPDRRPASMEPASLGRGPD